MQWFQLDYCKQVDVLLVEVESATKESKVMFPSWYATALFHSFSSYSRSCTKVHCHEVLSFKSTSFFLSSSGFALHTDPHNPIIMFNSVMGDSQTGIRDTTRYHS